MDDPVRAAHVRVLEELAKVWGGPLAGLKDFCPEPLPDAGAYMPVAPRARPVISQLDRCRGVTTPEFLPLIDALIAAADHIHWVRTYTTADGVDEDFLNRYGYLNFATPAGAFRTARTRITFAYWGEGLVYPEHNHGPEELYAVIAGGAVFRAEGLEPRRVRVGDTVFHESNQVHATDMEDLPLLCVIGWRGENVMALPEMAR